MSNQRSGLRWQSLELQTLLRVEDWLVRFNQIDTVINCVGILRQRWGERYEDLHHRLPAAIAAACAQQSVRFVHTSALGLHNKAKSRFLSSKRRGDAAIAVSGADYAIIRPSLIDGSGGFGASWLRALAQWPVHFVPSAAVGQISAVRADELAAAYKALVEQPSLADLRDCPIGGPNRVTYGQYLQVLRGTERAAPWVVRTPSWANRLGAHVCDGLRFSPFSYGHWILLQRDNVASPNRLPELLGRPPAPVTAAKGIHWADFRLS